MTKSKTLSGSEVAVRAGYLKGALDALETIANATADQNTRALCQKERERFRRAFEAELSKLPL